MKYSPRTSENVLLFAIHILDSYNQWRNKS